MPRGERSGDMDDLVKYHHSIQEKIADHMLDLTRSLKEQVSLAGQIVKKDTEVYSLVNMATVCRFPMPQYEYDMNYEYKLSLSSFIHSRFWRSQAA